MHGTSWAGSLLIDMVRLTCWLVILAVLFAPLERLFTLRRRELRRDWAADLGYFYLNSLLSALLLGPPLALMAAVARAITPDAYAAWVGGLPFVVKLLAGLVVGEIGSYWAHRWCHESRFLWRFHAIHHSIEHLDWLANTRAHPLDIVFVRLAALVPLYLLGLAQPTGGEGAMLAIAVTLLGTVWSFFIHANVRWRFGVLEHVIATPAFHHWHHTNDHNRDRNYAALLPWLDRLFGTLHLPREWPPCYGADEPVTGPMANELCHPFLPARRRPAAPAAPPATEGHAAG